MYSGRDDAPPQKEAFHVRQDVTRDGPGPASGRERPPTRRPLLHASAVLLVLILLLSVTARPLGLRPAALVGLPIAIIAATALMLLLLVITEAPGGGKGPDDPGERLELAFVPAVAVDPRTGRVVAANEEAAQLLGSAKVTVGSHFTELLTEGASSECRTLVQSAFEHGAAEVEACSVRTGTGAVRIAHLRARPTHGAEGVLVVVAFATNDTSQAVAEFAKVQERLMSNISHELRTPLNVVMGFSELLTTGTLGELAENQLDAAHEIHIGGERILRLVTDILDIGRSRSYYLPARPRMLDPAEMIRRMEALLSGQARREDVRVETRTPDDLPTIEVVERAFKQVVYHLILHSIDRSGPGDLVTVEAAHEGALTIIVTDCGPEPDADEAAPRDEVSFGEDEAREALAPPLLGLPLCATLAARLGGRLRVHGDADGYHFALGIPLSAPSDGS